MEATSPPVLLPDCYATKLRCFGIKPQAHVRLVSRSGFFFSNNSTVQMVVRLTGKRTLIPPTFSQQMDPVSPGVFSPQQQFSLHPTPLTVKFVDITIPFQVLIRLCNQ
jgi:hypothetical protein